MGDTIQAVGIHLGWHEAPGSGPNRENCSRKGGGPSQQSEWVMNGGQGLPAAAGGGRSRSGLRAGKAAAVGAPRREAGPLLGLHLLVGQQVGVVANWCQIIGVVPIWVLVLRRGRGGVEEISRQGMSRHSRCQPWAQSQPVFGNSPMQQAPARPAGR